MRDPDRIEICIRPDGRVYVDGMSEDMIEIAWALSPRDPAVAARMRLLQKVRAGRRRQEQDRERVHGDAAPGQGS